MSLSRVKRTSAKVLVSSRHIGLGCRIILKVALFVQAVIAELRSTIEPSSAFASCIYMLKVFRAHKKSMDLLLGSSVLGILLLVAVSAAFLWLAGTAKLIVF
jgi:hypothetical protein